MESSGFSSKAVELEARGDKTMKGSFFGNLMKGKGTRADEAKEFFTKAAHCYKLSQNMEKAIECYEKCIKCESSDADAAPHYKEIAICAKELDADKYTQYSLKAIDLYSLAGRTSQAARMAKECGEFLEENYDYEQALLIYTKAGQLYAMEGQTTQGHQMTLKACELKLLSKQWEQLPHCIKTYEGIAQKYLNTPILKSSAKDLFFLSCLCFMANEDVIGAKQKMQSYCIDDPSFDGSREQKLIESLIDCIQDKKADEFQSAVSGFNHITPFSKMKTSILVRIKEAYLPDGQIDDGPGGDGQEPDFTGAEPDFTGGDGGAAPQQDADDGYDFR